jgi:hypothetical protein
MYVFGFLLEEPSVRNRRHLASTPKVEADSGGRGSRRHIHGVRPSPAGSVDCFGPQCSSHSSPTIRVADVKEHEPRHVALESLFHNGDAGQLPLFERTEKCGTAFQNGLEEVEEPLHAVWTPALRRPTGHIDIDWATREFAGANVEEGVDAL